MKDEPAFPVFPTTGAGHASAFRGMSLRDYFAGQALTVIIAATQGWCEEGEAVKDAYSYADAMLLERDK